MLSALGYMLDVCYLYRVYLKLTLAGSSSGGSASFWLPRLDVSASDILLISLAI